MNKYSRIPRGALQIVCVAVVLISFRASAVAETLYWGVNGTALWQSAPNWFTDASGTTPATAFPGSADDVVFNITSLNATTAASLNANQAVDGITIKNTGTLVILGTGGNRQLIIGAGGVTKDAGSGTVTLGDSGASKNVFLRFQESQTWVNNSSSGLTIRNSAAASDTAAGPVTLTLNAAGSGSISNSGASNDSTNGASLAIVVASTGSGTVNLAGGNYSGGTTVKSGTLSSSGAMGTGDIWLGDTIGSANATLNLNTATAATNNLAVQAGSSGTKTLGSNANAVFNGTVTLNDSLTYNQSANAATLNGLVSGSGILTKSGTGSLALMAANTYSGGTVLNASGGVLRINNGGNSTASAIGTGSLTILGGSLDNTSGGEVTLGTNNQMFWGANFTFVGTNNLNLGTGSVTLNGSGARGVTVTSGTLTLGGRIGNGTATALGKLGNGTLVLSAPDSTYTGSTSVATGGVLEVTKLSNAGVASSIGAPTSTGGNTVLNGTGILRYVGTGDSTNRILTIGGGGGGSLDASGTGAIKFTNTSSSAFGSSNVAYVLNLIGNSTAENTYAANQANNGTGAFSIVKSGVGTWNLTGNNTYTGSTIVSLGTLLVNGSLAVGSQVTVESAATLGGSGTINGAATIRGLHSPGNSPGVQTFGGNLAYESGASVLWELNDNTVSNTPVAYDKVLVGGNLNFQGPTAFSLSFNGNGSSVNWSDAFWSEDRSWTIYSLTGAGVISGASNLAIASQNWADSQAALFNDVLAGSSFSLEESDTAILLKYSVVPEPGTWVLLLLACFCLAFRRWQMSVASTLLSNAPKMR